MWAEAVGEVLKSCLRWMFCAPKSARCSCTDESGLASRGTADWTSRCTPAGNVLWRGLIALLLPIFALSLPHHDSFTSEYLSRSCIKLHAIFLSTHCLSLGLEFRISTFFLFAWRGHGIVVMSTQPLLQTAPGI